MKYRSGLVSKVEFSVFYVVTSFDNMILSPGEKNIHIDGILQLISRCSQVPEALDSGLRILMKSIEHVIVN